MAKQAREIEIIDGPGMGALLVVWQMLLFKHLSKNHASGCHDPGLAPFKVSFRGADGQMWSIALDKIVPGNKNGEIHFSHKNSGYGTRVEFSGNYSVLTKKGNMTLTQWTEK